MSYILDALKKSEQERKRGQVPDLGATQLSLQRTRPRPVRWPYLLALGATLNAAVLFWWIAPWQGEKPAPQPEVRVVERIVTVPASPQPAPAAPTAVIVPPTQPAATPAPVASPRTVRQSGAVGQGASPSQAASVARQKETAPAEVARAAATQPAVQQEAEASIQETVGEQAPAADAPNQPVHEEALGQYEELINAGGGKNMGAQGGAMFPGEPQVPDIVDTRRIPTQVNRMQKEEMRAALKKMDTSKGGERLDVPDLSQLSPDLRKQVPPVTIALHFYSQTPASRKVSINGKMRREGDEVEAGLTVDEIVRDGVILRFRDKRFHIPVF